PQSPLQPYQIDQELAPKINHPAPGIFYIACRGLLEHALGDVMRDLIAQIVFYFRFDTLFIQRIDRVCLDAVSAEKLAMALIKPPKRLIRSLTVNPKLRSHFQPIGERVIPGRPNRSALRAR